MKPYAGVEFNSARDGGQGSASRPCRFTPTETILEPAVQEEGLGVSLALIGNHAPIPPFSLVATPTDYAPFCVVTYICSYL
jgi:hypothetical protein